MQARPPHPPFGHLLTAVITPFGDDGTVDYGAFWRLTRRLVADGSDGIVVAGTTGESPTLSTVEKVALFRAAVDAVGDQGLVIAGTGTYDTKESIELSEKAAEAGCDGIMLVTPYYSKPPQEGLYRHFTAVADAVDLPVLLYNIPGRTCRLIEVETLRRLADHPRIVAVKDAVDDLEWSRRAIEALPEGFAVYSGSDAMTLALMEHHAVGVVSVAAHLVGPHIRRFLDAMLAGEVEEARRLDERLQPLYEALFVEPNPMPVKAALDHLWGRVGEPRLPLVPASAATVRRIEELLAELEGE
ncbi:MAG TPA: 4-hydroxy-tetrahydrodipicolinate synthase [Actinobacteria bacterium]|nr:4-hydroxy-tetrahydrodipicolinate synthase [Actinomycetota bacterium]